MATIYQSDIMNTLSYLLGERTVPTTGTEGRKDFIQQTLNEVYHANPWKFAQKTATLTVTSGVATVPTDRDTNWDMEFTYLLGTVVTPLTEINEEDSWSANIGDNVYWITTTAGAQFFNTLEVITSAKCVYQQIAPTLDAAGTVGTPYTDKLAVALGARRYVRMSQDPEADISQDEALFKKRLAEDVSGETQSRPPNRRVSRQSQTGTYTGAI